jgi:hypothetical protein
VKQGAYPKSFRLTAEATELLRECAAARGVSETAVVEIAVRELAERWLRSAAAPRRRKRE